MNKDKNHYSLNGSSMISLLPFNQPDFHQLISWVQDEEMLMQFAGTSLHFPLTAEQLVISAADKNNIPYKILHIHDQTIIGHAEILLQDATSALLRRIFIGDKRYRGQGLSQYILKELLNIAFNKPGIEEVSLNVFDWNIPAIKCYEKAGFYINEGKTRTRHVKDQTWLALNMRLTKKTCQGLQKSD
jgi:RimJ/RimL family protein N-acetyltransferase